MSDDQRWPRLVEALERENEQLRARVDELTAREAKSAQSRSVLMRGGFRLLLPLFDRNKVARTFGTLVETAGGFAGPRESWPTRDQVLGDARVFLESVVRFVIRQRFFLAFFGLLGAAIPLVQVWLVIQQNEIINNQAKFSEIQVYDIVARSMTEGDRNARLMTGALLANAEPAFLSNVVRESFDPSLAGVYRVEGVNAKQRRLDDAAYRGHLIRAAVRSISTPRPKESKSELYQRAKPMLQWIITDAAARLPEVLRLGRTGGEEEPSVADKSDGDRNEQVDHYMVQVGAAVRDFARLARANGDLPAFGSQVAPLFSRLAQRSSDPGNRFTTVYRAVLQDILFDLAVQAKPGDPAPSLQQAGGDLRAALTKGAAELKGVAGEGANWDNLVKQASEN
jgi:hypothetical protein